MSGVIRPASPDKLTINQTNAFMAKASALSHKIKDVSRNAFQQLKDLFYKIWQYASHLIHLQKTTTITKTLNNEPDLLKNSNAVLLKKTEDPETEQSLPPKKKPIDFKNTAASPGKIIEDLKNKAEQFDLSPQKGLACLNSVNDEGYNSEDDDTLSCYSCGSKDSDLSDAETVKDD